MIFVQWYVYINQEQIYSEETAIIIDGEVKSIIDKAYIQLEKFYLQILINSIL